MSHKWKLSFNKPKLDSLEVLVNSVLFYAHMYLGLYDKVYSHPKSCNCYFYTLTNQKWLVNNKCMILQKKLNKNIPKRLSSYLCRPYRTILLAGMGNRRWTRERRKLPSQEPAAFTFVPLQKGDSGRFLEASDSPPRKRAFKPLTLVRQTHVSDFEMSFLCRFFSFWPQRL